MGLWVRVGRVLISSGGTWVYAGGVLDSSGDMGASWVGADQQWRHRCVLAGCWTAVETWVRAGLVLISNGDMGVRGISNGDMGCGPGCC